MPLKPAAIQKVEPGTKRVLSGMVAEALTLAKKGSLSKAVFSVLTCSGEDSICRAIQAMVQTHLAHTHKVNTTDKDHATDIVEFVQHHRADLVVAEVNNIHVANAVGESRIFKAVELLGQMKARHSVPVIAFSTCTPESFNLREELSNHGIYSFLPSPFDFREFQNVLNDLMWNSAPDRTR